ncbi:uncharacterized protein SCHCODRAFT_02613450 [Schizophyllum commune H4-8]|nr:uncharacterized protein SCHCODRAFT_02613450 [Schizophyllum commune H4-8]KAI5898883.1 hypothetical protein SCHCODRAFT_02613450 [Schizophyllum commune H4-8]
MHLYLTTFPLPFDNYPPPAPHPRRTCPFSARSLSPCHPPPFDNLPPSPSPPSLGASSPPSLSPTTLPHHLTLVVGTHSQLAHDCTAIPHRRLTLLRRLRGPYPRLHHLLLVLPQPLLSNCPPLSPIPYIAHRPYTIPHHLAASQRLLRVPYPRLSHLLLVHPTPYFSATALPHHPSPIVPIHSQLSHRRSTIPRLPRPSAIPSEALPFDFTPFSSPPSLSLTLSVSLIVSQMALWCRDFLCEAAPPSTRSSALFEAMGRGAGLCEWGRGRGVLEVRFVGGLSVDAYDAVSSRMSCDVVRVLVSCVFGRGWPRGGGRRGIFAKGDEGGGITWP